MIPNGMRCCLGRRLGLVRLDRDKMDPRFFLFYYISPQYQDFLRSRTVHGATVDRLLLTDFPAFQLPVPPLIEQQAIGVILGALDNKIELIRRMNRTLEEMARALFRSWFVDFNPVHAKAAGLPPAHMDAATAALFPDRLGEDGLPAGWVNEPIGDHFRAKRGLSYKGSGLCKLGEGLPMHNLNSIFEGGGYKTDGIKFYKGPTQPRHAICGGDLIVANTEQAFDHELIGYSALVPSHYGPMGVFSQHLFKIDRKPSSPLSREWLHFALCTSATGTIVRSFSNGTTVNMLPPDAFELPLITVPTGAVVAAFNDTVRPMISRQEAAEVETQTLASLRDTLLPKPMSGEIRVRDAERAVAEVA